MVTNHCFRAITANLATLRMLLNIVVHCVAVIDWLDYAKTAPSLVSDAHISHKAQGTANLATARMLL